MQAHDLCAIFPEMPDDQLDELVTDIIKNGLLEPIILYEGAILDGRHRHIACVRAKIQPRYEDYKGTDPLAFVMSKNLARRHLDTSQRAMVGAKIANLIKGRPKENAKKSAITQPQAAAKLHVSRGSVQNAQKVLATGTKALAKAVDDGRIAVHKAAKIATLPAAQQAKAMEEPAKPKLALVPTARPNPRDEWIALSKEFGVEMCVHLLCELFYHTEIEEALQLEEAIKNDKTMEHEV